MGTFFSTLKMGMFMPPPSSPSSQVWYTIRCYVFWPIFRLLTGKFGGFAAGLQDIDGYYYYPPGVCPRRKIEAARAYEWLETDFVVASYPKSGTHFLVLTALLVGFRGELPPRIDLHSMCCSVEFENGEKGDNSKPLDAPLADFPTKPRVCISHMPFHHLNNPETSPSSFVYVMRDPVATLASARRMEYLIFGPYLSPSMDIFIHYQLHVRKTGWLDHVLGWWSARNNPNVLVLTYESMVSDPIQSVRRLAAHMRLQLTESEVRKCAERMDKKWALENVDPYLFKAGHNPFSPPDRDGRSKSGFITDNDKFSERMTPAQEFTIRSEYTKKIKTLMASKQESVAALAESFYKENRAYFGKKDS